MLNPISELYNPLLEKASLTLTLDWFLKSTAAFFFPRVLSEFSSLSSFLQTLNVLCFLNSYWLFSPKTTLFPS